MEDLSSFVSLVLGVRVTLNPLDLQLPRPALVLDHPLSVVGELVLEPGELWISAVMVHYLPLVAGQLERGCFSTGGWVEHCLQNHLQNHRNTCTHPLKGDAYLGILYMGGGDSL